MSVGMNGVSNVNGAYVPQALSNVTLASSLSKGSNVNNLERTPACDDVSFSQSNSMVVSKKELKDLDDSLKYHKSWNACGYGAGHITGENYDIKVSDAGMNFIKGQRSIEGQINGKDVKLALKKDLFFTYNGLITGTIDGQNVNIKYKNTKDGIELTGLNDANKDLGKDLALFASNKITFDKQVDADVAVVACC